MNYRLPTLLDWRRFQDFCVDILKAEGFTIVRKSGIGPDRGRDILVERNVQYGPRCSKPFRWLVQCKHRQSDRTSIRPEDVGDFLSDITRHNADGYWLMTNTYLSSGLEDKLASVSAKRELPYQAVYSDASDLVSYLHKHRSIMRKYFLVKSTNGHAGAGGRALSPFKELQAYTEEDRLLFFGRDRERDGLMDRIYMHRIVGLFGESGTGKTSLIHAGIVPMLREEGLLPIVVRCLAEPIMRVRKAVLAQLKEEEIKSGDLDALGATAEFADFVSILQVVANHAGLRIVLAIDQLEELFTRCRNEEMRALAMGILEATGNAGGQNSLTFLLSLREDYIGSLWEWSHSNALHGAWINTYRIGRMSEESAVAAISSPLEAVGIVVQPELLSELTSDLRILGDGRVYPPYLQLACSGLFEEYSTKKGIGKSQTITVALYHDLGRAESMIADYISSSMLEGLNERDKLLAQQILDLLTGPEGLRAFLSRDEVARYLQMEDSQASRVLEHLTQKKVVHPVVEDDQLVGYELVHDFLSRRFFESLSPEAKKMKTVLELFRRALHEWRQYGVLASKDRLDMFGNSVEELKPTEEEYSFLLKSSLVVFSWDNPWAKIIPEHLTVATCIDLLHDQDHNIAERAIGILSELKSKKAVPHLRKLILSGSTPYSVKREAISAFNWRIVDKRILSALRKVINEESHARLRANAVDALGWCLRVLSDKRLTTMYLPVLFEVLTDSRANVRAKAAEELAALQAPNITDAFLDRLSVEISVIVRKKLVDGLARVQKSDPRTVQVLKRIAMDREEDPRVQHAAAVAVEVRQAE